MKQKRLTTVVLVLSALLLVATLAYAQGEFTLSWWTVDNGGGLSEGGDFSLQEVIGQPDAGMLQGGDFSLSGGFLNGITSIPSQHKNSFLPLVVK